MAWVPAKDGLFSVKRAYWFAHYVNSLESQDTTPSSSNNSIQKTTCKEIWNSVVLPRLSTWVWQASRSRLPIGYELNKRNMLYNDNCAYCQTALETITHIFCTCSFAMEVRSLLLMHFQLDKLSSDILNIWTDVLQDRVAIFWQEFTLCWHLQKIRNKRLFSCILITAMGFLQMQNIGVLLKVDAPPPTSLSSSAQQSPRKPDQIVISHSKFLVLVDGACKNNKGVVGGMILHHNQPILVGESQLVVALQVIMQRLEPSSRVY